MMMNGSSSLGRKQPLTDDGSSSTATAPVVNDPKGTTMPLSVNVNVESVGGGSGSGNGSAGGHLDSPADGRGGVGAIGGGSASIGPPAGRHPHILPPLEKPPRGKKTEEEKCNLIQFYLSVGEEILRRGGELIVNSVRIKQFKFTIFSTISLGRGGFEESYQSGVKMEDEGK